ncbi:hypothetical protein IFR05_008799 [Cadophora sp. M221]|nr:hypothetical protein IFR05_008799 [Cadophora sp. M221]
MSTQVTPTKRPRPKHRNRAQPPAPHVPVTDAVTDPTPNFRAIAAKYNFKVLHLALAWIMFTPLYENFVGYYLTAAPILTTIITRAWLPACVILTLVGLYFGLACLQVIPVALLFFVLISAVLAIVHVLFALPRIVRYLLARPSRILYTVCCGVFGFVLCLCWVKGTKLWYNTKEPPLVFVECGPGMECLQY